MPQRQTCRKRKRYICSVLSNPSASRQTLKRIATQLNTLEQFPEAGTSILIPGSPVAYRYLICGSYMVFYHIHNEEVIVDRILYGRRDYLSILFGKELTEEIDG
ncbi:MAG: type II toxin-antitoxin system RelE/ParE family toxin [Huintestinicola sp.]